MGDTVLSAAEQLVLQLLEGDEDPKEFVDRYGTELEKDLHRVQAVAEIVKDWPEFQMADKTTVDFAVRYKTPYGYTLEWNATLYWENLAALTGVRTGADDPPQIMGSYGFLDQHDEYHEIQDLEDLDRRRYRNSLLFLAAEYAKFKQKLATAVKFIDPRP